MRVTFACIIVLGGIGISIESQSAASLFTDQFEHGLARWEVIGEGAVSLRPSGDPQHGPILALAPNGDVAALIRGSERWGPVRMEGEMLFPTDENNYLGFVYNFTARGARRDFGLVYVKGNESYLQMNPHRDFNVSRTIYPELRVPLDGPAAITTGVWQRFALEVAGRSAHVYVGDGSVPQMTFTDLELSGGALGLQPRSVGGPVWVDNVSVHAIDRLSYQGPARPSPPYAASALITDWQLAGPFVRTDDRIARHPSGAQWTRFQTDARGAVVTGRVVDYHGQSTVAYFKTTLRSDVEGQGMVEFSTADDLAVWTNGEFQAFVPRQESAWFDLHATEAHRGRLPIALKAGGNELVVRVRGGVYASGGFFARLARVS